MKNKEQKKKVSEQKVFVNGKFVRLKSAKISFLDRGFLYGDGVFETMRAYNGKVFRLDSHIERLLDSLKALKIRSPYTSKQLRGLIQKTIALNKLQEAYVKIIVSRGEGGSGIDVTGREKSLTIIYAKDHPFIPDNIYKKGVRLCFASMPVNERVVLSCMKTLNYVMNIASRMDAREKGFYDALLRNTKGRVTEATTSNIFIIKKGVLYTPPVSDGLLPGITRQDVKDIVKKYTDNKIVIRSLKKKDVLKADEIFLTNSTLEVFPVVMIGSRKIGSGKPGAFTRIIRALYRAEVNNV